MALNDSPHLLHGLRQSEAIRAIVLADSSCLLHGLYGHSPGCPGSPARPRRSSSAEINQCGHQSGSETGSHFKQRAHLGRVFVFGAGATSVQAGPCQEYMKGIRSKETMQPYLFCQHAIYLVGRCPHLLDPAEGERGGGGKLLRDRVHLGHQLLPADDSGSDGQNVMRWHVGRTDQSCAVSLVRHSTSSPPCGRFRLRGPECHCPSSPPCERFRLASSTQRDGM